MALDQLDAADQHWILNDLEDLPDPGDELTGKVLLFTGPQVEPNRVGSPSLEMLAGLKKLAETWDCPLIIEADGARKLPVKAPADHEPPIPDFVDTVITVIGLSGLGKPLDSDWVHRPEIYSSLVGLPLGARLESEHLVKELTSPQGGLKNIPPGARKILLINQIDSFPNWKTFYTQMDSLLASYQAVGFSVLEDQMLLEVHERIAGIVLAAGGSTRFGEPKQLLDWFGEPLVKFVAENVRAGGCSPILVITGADHDTVSLALDGLPVQVVNNTAWQTGQSSSVKAAIQALPDDIGGAIFCLVDQPRIPQELISSLTKKTRQESFPDHHARQWMANRQIRFYSTDAFSKILRFWKGMLAAGQYLINTSPHPYPGMIPPARWILILPRIIRGFALKLEMGVDLRRIITALPDFTL